MISGEFRLYPELFRRKCAVCAVIYNPKAEFFTNWYKVDTGYWNDLNENFVVFYAAAA